MNAQENIRWESNHRFNSGIKEPRNARGYKVVWDEGTSAEVAMALAGAFWRRNYVRIWYGTPEKPDWMEENDVCGHLGISNGEKPCLIILNNARSSGGPGVLTACISRLYTGTMVLYQASWYKTPEFVKVPAESSGYAVGVRANGELHAQFRSEQSADRWIQFMIGNSKRK